MQHARVVPDETLNRFLARFAAIAAVATIAWGSLVLLGWALGLPLFTSMLPVLATMKPLTALSFVLLGASLLLLRREALSHTRRLLGRALALLVASLGALVLLEYLSGASFGIDALLFPTAVRAENWPHPGRPAQGTALSLMLLGLALVALTYQFRRLSAILTALPLAIGTLTLVGYAYDVRAFYQIGPFSSIALNTGLLILLLALGIVAARPELPPFARLITGLAGSTMARRLLPAAILLPFCIGWLRLQGERLGLYNTEFGLALFATSNILVFSTLVYWTAGYLNRADALRELLLQDMRLLNETLEQRVGERTAELTQVARATESLYQVTRLALAVEDLPRALQSITELTARVLEADRVICFVFNHQQREVLHRAYTGPLPQEPVQPTTYDDLMQSLIGWTIREGRSTLSSGCDLREPKHMQERRAAIGAESIVVVPIVHEGETNATITAIRHADQSAFTANDLIWLETVAAQIGASIARLQLLDQFQTANQRLEQQQLQLQHELDQRQRAETALLASLQEKEVLLKEIHHRVKNNLQVISSLLRMQANSESNPTVRERFNESQQRVRSMALIHEHLYGSRNLAQIDFGGYVGELLRHLRRAYSRQVGQISLRVEIEQLSLPIATALPLGLIVNELVSNSFKHGLADSLAGELWVCARRDPELGLILEVGDDGAGLPHGFAIDEAESMGMQIVAAFVTQLDAFLSVENRPGAVFTLMVPESVPAHG
jgi:two-component sensor histidine kinase